MLKIQSTSYKDLHVVGGTARGIGLVFIVGERSGGGICFIPAGLMLFLLLFRFRAASDSAATEAPPPSPHHGHCLVQHMVPSAPNSAPSHIIRSPRLGRFLNLCVITARR